MSELKAKAVFEGLRFLSLGSTKLHLKGYRFFLLFLISEALSLE